LIIEWNSITLYSMSIRANIYIYVGTVPYVVGTNPGIYLFIYII